MALKDLYGTAGPNQNVIVDPITGNVSYADQQTIQGKPGWSQLNSTPEEFARNAAQIGIHFDPSVAVNDPQYDWIAPTATVNPILLEGNNQQTARTKSRYGEGMALWAAPLAIGAAGVAAAGAGAGAGAGAEGSMAGAAGSAADYPVFAGGGYMGNAAEAGLGSMAGDSALIGDAAGDTLSPWEQSYTNPSDPFAPGAGTGAGASAFGQYGTTAADLANLPAAELGGTVASGAPSFWDSLTTPTNLMRAGTSLAGTLGNLYAANKATGAQTDAANQANATLWAMYNQNRADLAPWRNAGGAAVGRLADLTTPGKQLSTMEMDPGYQWRFDQGQIAQDRSAAARGGLQSGQALKAAQQYGQNFATGEYGNVYNRLSNLAGLGQTAVNTGVAAGTNTANNVAQNQTSIGNTRASGYVAGANALTGGLSQFMSGLTQDQLIAALLSRG